MKVLVIEDQTSKLRAIVSCLCTVPGLGIDDIEECRDAVQAKRRMSRQKYDLLILDIAIPERVDQEPRPDGGIRLLEEITEEDRYILPEHIIGLTAYPDLQQDAQL